MILDIIRHLIPEAQVIIIGEPANADEYAAQITWADDRPQPTWADIENARPTVEANQARQTIEQARRQAFVLEADPLFFGWQRGENTEQVWLDKVAEIRNRHPYSSDG